MTLGTVRDMESLRAGLEYWLGRPVGEITRPTPGWSCETVVIDRHLVVRLPPVADGIFPTYELEQQAAVQEALDSAGVPVASPVTYEPDCSFLETAFLAMPFVDGPIPTELTGADPWLRSLPDDDARHTVWRSFIETIADIHAVPVDGLRLRAGLDAELDFWDGYLAWATDGEPPPGIAEALAWCRAHRPAREPKAGLLWGDVRLGNVVFDSAVLTPKAVLDWDMASAGPIEMDLGWFLALEQLQGDLTGMTIPGFGTREEAMAVVENRIGRTLVDLDWYEIFALLRASAVSTRIAILFERDGRETMFKLGADPAFAAAAARIAVASPGSR